MKSLITKDFGITNAKNFEKMVSNPLANVYVMLGHNTAWPNVADPSLLDDSEIETPYDTTSYKNELLRKGQVYKRVTSNDIQPVVPRVDWAANVVYVPYEQTTNLFVKVAETQVSGGNVNVAVGLRNTVVANGINFSISNPIVSVGDVIKIGNEVREVIAVNSAALVVNTNFTNAYTSANLFELTYSTTQYSNKFYVRNSQDQIFKCLFNNGGIQSNTMPKISLGGELPENPYVETVDGYKWKYMYTIPTGLKNKFFTDKYMPVLRESIVFDNSQDGRIDIIKIINGGSGYYAGSTVNNYAIATVTGDGSLANVSVDVTNGVISEINILEGGRNYSRANVVLDDPLQTITGADANLQVIISPQYGHGWDAVRELGASSLMISVDFEGDVEGNLPVEADGTDLMRQICITKDIKFANGSFATGSVYPMYTTILTSTPAVGFEHNSRVFVGSSYENAIFTATVVHFDSTSNQLIVNEIDGNLAAIENESIRQRNSPSIIAKVFEIIPPDINILSGEILYIENRQKIIRNPNQTETIKLVVEF